MKHRFFSTKLIVGLAGVCMPLLASATQLAPLARQMKEALSFERQAETFLAENARKSDAMIMSQTQAMANQSNTVNIGPSVKLEPAMPELEFIDQQTSAGQVRTNVTTSPMQAPATVKYGSMYSKDVPTSGNVKNYAMKLTSHPTTDSISNVYGLGTSAAITIDASTGTVSLPAQKIYDHSVYGPVYICPVKITPTSITYDKNGTITGKIDANGNISLPSWGVFVVEGSSAGGAFAIFSESQWFAANASIRISLTDNSNLNVDAYVEQRSSNELTIYNFAGTGAAADAILTNTGSVLVAPQFMINLGSNGIFYCYSVDWTTNKVNMSTPITGKATANTIVFGGWILGAHRTANPIGLAVTRSVITLKDGNVELPSAPAAFTGSGTQSSPFLIKTADDLTALSQRVQGGETFAGQYFRLNSDIDMSTASKGFFPIGDLLFQFGGKFDGDGKTIKNLTIDAKALGNGGLFGYTSAESEISNLTLQDVKMQGTGSYLGAICGTNYGKITNCHVSGSLWGESLFTGGITGAAWGPVSNCSFKGSITTICIAGGITGTDFNEIRNCHVDADMVITGALDTYYHDIAGIAGVAVPGKDMTQTISDCTFTGSLTDTGGYGYLAGIVSKAQNANIERCANTGSISGIRVNRDNDVYAGGIVAWCNKSTITDCLNSGTIVKSGSVASMGNGGIVGYFSIGYQILHDPPVPTDLSTVKNCINTGQIVSSYTPGRKGIWGYTFFKDAVPDPIGENVSNCYNDFQATGLRDDKFNATTATLTSGQLPQGFSTDVWKAVSGRYPVIKSMPENIAALASSNLLLAEEETTNKVKRPMTIQSDPMVKWSIFSGNDYVQETAGMKINGNTIELKDTYSNEVICARLDESHYKLYRVSTIPDLFEGEGTEERPYLIRNVEDFINLDKAVSNYSQTHEGDVFRMTNDVDFNFTTSFSGVGLTSQTGFAGIFDGNGHTIHRLKIHTARFDGDNNALSTGLSYGGLFSKVRAEGVIKNVNIANDCDFIFHEYGGAVVGSLVGRVENCRNYAEVKGVSHNMGGLVGQSAAGTVSRCYNSGRVLAGGYGAGGIVGENIGRIEFCQNDGEISAELYSTLWPRLNRYRVGGIAGLNRGEIEGCANQGPVRCLKDVGGIAGESTKSGSNFTGNIINCLSTGPVECTGTTESTRGAIVGKIGAYEQISGNVYDLGVLTDGAIAGNSVAGVSPMQTSDLVKGTLPESLPDSLYVASPGSYPVLRLFADEPASKAMSKAYPIFTGKQTCINVGSQLPLSAAEGLVWTLRHGNKGFSISGSNLSASVSAPDLFAADTLVATTDGKYVKVFPVQILRKVFEGEGTEASPYLIRNNSELITLSEMIEATRADYRNEYFRLTTDLTFGSGEMSQIASGINRFQADFDGNGKKITYIMSNSEQKGGVGLGLFGTVGETGKIHHLTVEPTINGYSHGAGLVAYLYGVVSDCVNLGSLTTTSNYAGGLAAVVYGGGRLANCRNEGNVTSGAGYAGGLAAQIQKEALATDCSNAGKVTAASSSTGGIVGNLTGIVKNCSNSGTVTARSYSGGIVGGLGTTGKVYDCVNTADITSNSGGYVAGIVGNTTVESTDACIVGCSNSGTIEATSYAAGIVSQLRDGIRLDSCINTGKIISMGSGAAGIAAKIEGKVNTPTVVSHSINEGSITASGQYVGGVVGQISTYASLNHSYNIAPVVNRKGEAKVYLTGGLVGICSGSIANSWNAGDVECDGYGTGGLVGYVSGGTVDRCYSLGNVKTRNLDTPEGYGSAGGFVGYIGGSGTVSNSYCTGAVEAPDNLGGFAGTIFSGAKLTNVYTLSKVTATDAAPQLVSQVTSYANSNATDANTTLTNVYYLHGNNSVTSAPDKRAKALTRPEFFSAPLGTAFIYRRAAFPTLKEVESSYARIAAASYDFGREGDTEDNVTDALWIPELEDVVWTSSPQFEILGARAYTKSLGEGWIEAALPDGSLKRRFEFTVRNISGVTTIASDKEIFSRTFYTPEGLTVQHPEAGKIYIERIEYTDGTVKSRRIVMAD